MSLPYFRLYPTDYEADTAHLTLAEDGAYNRLLRLCWRTSTCSLPDDDQWIKRRLRVSDQEYDEVVIPVLDEFFKRDKQRVFSDRLLEEFEQATTRHQAASENGKKGGRKNKQLKINKKQGSNGFNLGSDPLKLNKANQNQNQNHNNIGDFFEDDQDQSEPENTFDDWYQHYTNKKGRGQAEKAFKAAMKIATFDQLVEGAKAYCATFEGRDKTYMKHPATWLNGKGWLDEDICAVTDQPDTPRARWGAAIAKWQQDGKQGPAPRIEDYEGKP